MMSDPIEFDPSVVCFGGYKAKPAGKVSIAPHGISIEVESPPDPTENVMVTIEWAYIVKSIFARGDKTAFLFRTLITFVERIESALRFYELRLRDPSLDLGDAKWFYIETNQLTDDDIAKITNIFPVCDEITLREMEPMFKLTLKGKMKPKKKPKKKPVDEFFSTGGNILIYPELMAPGSIILTANDYKCLAVDEFLNDSIINFYIKYLSIEILTDEQKPITYMFDTFFYENLSGASRRNPNKQHERIEKWTRRVNIFQKDFIVVPINQSLHWFLAIICFPGINTTVPSSAVQICQADTTVDGTDDSFGPPRYEDDKVTAEQIVKKPCILIFDSLSSESRNDVIDTLRNYLNCEYKVKAVDNSGFKFNSTNMPGHKVKSPTQHNVSDCGLFMLQNIEKFFKNPIKSFELPIESLANWFTPAVASQKRTEIAEIIKKQMVRSNVSLDELPHIELPE